MAGCGAGEDAAHLSDGDRAALRKQARTWLQADLDAWRGLLDKGPEKARPAAAQQMRNWLSDPELNSVRDPNALSKLPEAERQEWQKFWSDVADTLAKVRGKTAPEETSDMK
jgi:hypothetical protein